MAQRRREYFFEFHQVGRYVKVSAIDTLTNTGSAVNGIDDSETAFAYQALAGFGFGLTEQLTFDLGYRYFVVAR